MTIVFHVNAYLTSFTEAVLRDCCPQKSIAALEKTLDRLKKRKYLQLVRDMETTIVRLGHQAVRDFDFSSHRTKLPGPEALPRDLTIVRYCVFGQPKRDRLSPTELRAIFADFPEHLLSVPWCIDAEQSQLLAMMVMGTSSGDAMLKRVEEGQQRLLCAGGCIRRLIKRNQLHMVILTQDRTRQDEMTSVLPKSLRIPTRVVEVSHSIGNR